MNQETQNNQVETILTKCWEDENFKQKLLTDPTATLKAQGVDIPTGFTVRVFENTAKVINFVLPPNPNSELSDLELEAVAGGKGPHLPVGQGGHGIHNMHLTLSEITPPLIKK